MKEACWVNETTFWKPDDKQRENIVRSGRVQDVEDGLSEFPHVILNQARVHDFYLDVMRKSPARLEPHYARRLLDLRDRPGGRRRRQCLSVSSDRQARAASILSTRDRSRRSRPAMWWAATERAAPCARAIGRALRGDSANHAWGVMDVLAVTDFPDIRFKSLIQSANDGSIIIIPREGGYLFRLYIEMDKLDAGERVSNRNITADDLIAAARRILKPHTLDVKEVAWWSVYEIGQRLCDKFDDVPEEDIEERLPRVFIAGDACHTHSPKAGQGMNVSMQDGFNLGWKLASVLRKRCAPHLLHTYSAERQAIAKELIDFDREWAEMTRFLKIDRRVDRAKASIRPKRRGISSGTGATRREPRPTTVPRSSPASRPISIWPKGWRSACAFIPRRSSVWRTPSRFTSATRSRRTAAGASSPLPERRIPPRPTPASAPCATFLPRHASSPVRKYTPAGEDIDAVIDVRAMFQQGHRELAVEAMPSFLLPPEGTLRTSRLRKNVLPRPRKRHTTFSPCAGIDRERGCMVVVRPDQYVAHVLPLDGYAQLAAFFDGFMTGRH